MKKHIPNALTCLNLITGCISIVLAFKGYLEWASILIIVSACFDFLDGFAARLLHVKSPIGKDLDSLADVVSFGVVPSVILFLFMEQVMLNLSPEVRGTFVRFLPYCVFIIPAFSALRLAKFNHDERQQTDFIGLNTPANAMFIGFLHIAANDLLFLNNFWILLALVFIFSFLLNSNIRMFSLKFQTYVWKGNEVRYSFLAVSLILLILFRLGAFPVIILTYILFSLGMIAISKFKI